MITVEEAKQLLFGKVEKSEVAEINLSECLGHVLAEDILSPIELPLFDQSSMDGYAVAGNNLAEIKQFELIGEIKAGGKDSFALQPGQAVRIFTGGAVPASADAVVIQEKVKQENRSIFLMEDFHKGSFIRRKGSQIKKGEVALKKYTVLNPASIGFLASLGISKVSVYKKPTVSILATGDEIILPGSGLKAGQVYESNSFSLSAALQQMRLQPQNILYAGDERDELKAQVEKCLSDSDITIITGGISVGKYDFVLEILNKLFVEVIFYKVAQKPGKPLLAGKLNKKLIFALPGNPASALVCFYEYVYPAIRMMQGIESASLSTKKLSLLQDISTQENRALFIRSKMTNDGVMPLEGRDSNALRSFAQADVLIYIPKDRKKIKQEEAVEVHLLPI